MVFYHYIIIGRIQHYTSRKACDIQSLGDESIVALYEAGLIKDIADLYRLSTSDIVNLERMGEKSANNMIEGIAKSKDVPFFRVLFGLGIRYVGATVAKKLVNHFKNIDNLAKASIEELENVDEIGKVIAESLHAYLNNPMHWQMIERLKEADVQLASTEKENIVVSNVLIGKTVVISGVFSKFSREQLGEMIAQHGGKQGSGVTSKTDFLLAGDKMGPSKLEKAEKLGVNIISEDEFLEMIAE